MVSSNVVLAFLILYANAATTVERVAFFQENIPDESGPFSDNDMMELIKRYIFKQ